MGESLFHASSGDHSLEEECGLRTLLLIGCEGVVAGHEEKVNELEGEVWQTWVELNYRLGMEPALHGASDHLLYVGEKPEGRKVPDYE